LKKRTKKLLLVSGSIGLIPWRGGCGQQTKVFWFFFLKNTLTPSGAEK
jgi:hypothetical protein